MTGEYNLVLGEKAARGKGDGTEGTQLVLDDALTVLGRHHECKGMGGQLWDALIMACRVPTFASAVLRRIYRPDLPP